MNDKMIPVILKRDDRIFLGKHLTAEIGRMTDVMPAVRLIEALAKSGVKTAEADPYSSHRERSSKRKMSGEGHTNGGKENG